MNERIKELLKQASKLANTEYNKDFDRNFDVIVAKKFAELIIRDCLDITRWKDYEMSNEQRIRLGIYQDIKKHFGIEE